MKFNMILSIDIYWHLIFYTNTKENIHKLHKKNQICYKRIHLKVALYKDIKKQRPALFNNWTLAFLHASSKSKCRTKKTLSSI